MVRVAGLFDQLDAGIDARGPDGLPPGEQIDAIQARVLELDRRLHACFDGKLRPALEEQGIRIVSLDSASEEERREIDARFHEQVFPALTPLVIGGENRFHEQVFPALTPLVIGSAGPFPTSPTSRSASACCCATPRAAARSSPGSRCRRSCSAASCRSARAARPSCRWRR